MRMSPGAVGNVVPLSGANDGVIPEGSPPTSYAAHAVLGGEPGAIIRFGALTILRSLLVAPGLAIAGIRGKPLLYGSLASSGMISAFAIAYCYAQMQMAKNSAPANVVDTTAEAG